MDERRVEKKDTEEENYSEIREEFKHHGSETIEGEKTTKMQQEQQVEKGNLEKKRKKKMRLRLMNLKFLSLKGYRRQS